MNEQTGRQADGRTGEQMDIWTDGHMHICRERTQCNDAMTHLK